MRKTLIITCATLVLVALASITALFALAALAGERGPCRRANSAELRQSADARFGAEVTSLARCDRPEASR
jgi:uncharacterized membrane protein YdfJ with MMPL/SSD domain